MSILSTSDFTGKFQLAVNTYTENDFSEYFERYEREYLVKLLGAELYGKFYAGLEQVTPQKPKFDPYKTLFDPLQFDDGTEPVISHGIKAMLKGFVYYHYVKDNNLYHTISGLQTNNLENADSQSVSVAGSQYITSIYAEALETFDAIQRYIGANASKFPDFNGVSINRSYVFW